MNQTKAIKILLEIAKRNREIPWFDNSFKEQIDLVNDQSKQISALCSRRAAKSYSIGLKLLKCAVENPGSVSVYLGLTRESARRTMVNPILKKINKKLNLGAKFTKAPLACELPNGSIIYLAGVNNTDDEQEKLLGQKYKMIVIDECASYTIDLKLLLTEVLGPSTIDEAGQIIMIGTPGHLRNFFYNITTGVVPGWSNHKWSTSKNPHTSKQFLASIEKFKKENPEFLDTPSFKMHYLGQWVIDDTKKLYKYSDKNLINKLPGNKSDYHFILGNDLGWIDQNSFIVGAYSLKDPTLYIVYSFARNKMLMDDMIAKIREIQQLYPIGSFVIDSANKQYVEDMRYRSRIPFEAATKIDKIQTIHMLNTDMMTGRIKILSSCTQLIEELNTLLLDDSDPAHPKELASQSNHCADAFLYVWRKSLHYNSKPSEQKKKTTPAEQVDQWERREMEKLHIEQNNPDNSDPVNCW